MSLRHGYWVDCDGPGCHEDNGMYASRTTALATARLQGWTIRRTDRGRRYLCPSCSKRATPSPSEPTRMSEPRPVEKCACGADCSWCVAANKARAAFPRAKVPPSHDADTDHHCTDCFLKLPDLKVTTCTEEAMRVWIYKEPTR